MPSDPRLPGGIEALPYVRFYRDEPLYGAMFPK
jgi:hypothetical protein